MHHRLPRTATCICNRSEIFTQSQFFNRIANTSPKRHLKICRCIFCKIKNVCIFTTWYYQHVNTGAWRNIIKSQHIINHFK